jgi:hypothetical protein
MEIEEDGAAAEERFDVALEGDRIESAERRKQLAFAARPFQQGTSGGIATRALARCSLSARIAQPILVVMTSAPLVSVLLTAYNREEYVGRLD